MQTLLNRHSPLRTLSLGLLIFSCVLTVRAGTIADITGTLHGNMAGLSGTNDQDYDYYNLTLNGSIASNQVTAIPMSVFYTAYGSQSQNTNGAYPFVTSAAITVDDHASPAKAISTLTFPVSATDTVSNSGTSYYSSLRINQSGLLVFPFADGLSVIMQTPAVNATLASTYSTSSGPTTFTTQALAVATYEPPTGYGSLQGIIQPNTVEVKSHDLCPADPAITCVIDPLLPGPYKLIHEDCDRDFGLAPVSCTYWTDPSAAPELDYSMVTPGSHFLGIAALPTGFANPFMVTADGVTLGMFGAGDGVLFPNGGVTSFSISGLNPSVDPATFALQLIFDQTADFKVSGSDSAAATPEPGSVWLMVCGIACGCFYSLRTRAPRATTRMPRSGAKAH